MNVYLLFSRYVNFKDITNSAMHFQISPAIKFYVVHMSIATDITHYF